MKSAVGQAPRDDLDRQVLMVDPSLFTAPYDACLSGGLREAGIGTVWTVRALRSGEELELDPRQCLPFFYSWTDGPRRLVGRVARLLKGVEHALGLRTLVALAKSRSFLLVHFHWLLVPALDRRAIRAIRRHRPVVVTVHDSEPFNGKAVGRAQRAGFDEALALADRLIVHTASAKQALVARGHDGARIAIVPHGVLGGRSAGVSVRRRGPSRRWTVVQFGKMQQYKGIDVLVEALGQMPPAVRDRLQVVVAGEALIDLAPIRARAAALGITVDDLQFRPHYLSSTEIDALVEEADAFVFPYRAIEASGALLRVAEAGKWIVASRLGSFTELVGEDDRAGELVPPGDIAALAAALARSIGREPSRSLGDHIPDWATIGRMTANVYRDALETWRGTRAQAGAN